MSSHWEQEQARVRQEQAKQKIDDLKTDPKFHERYFSSDQNIKRGAMKEMEQLHFEAYGDAPIGHGTNLSNDYWQG